MNAEKVGTWLTLADKMKTYDTTPMMVALVALCSAAYAETNITITGIWMGPSNAVIVRWPSETGRWYRLEQTANLPSGSFDTLFPTTDATSPINLYTNTTCAFTTCFFRVISDKADFTRHDWGTDGSDTQIFIGTTNRDRIVQFGYGSNDMQYASGLDQDDWIEQDGGEGDDVITATGGAGMDLIFQTTGSGSNILSAIGGTDDDRIIQIGGSGVDNLIADGGDGSDNLTVESNDGGDRVQIAGGAGSDTVVVRTGAGSDDIIYQMTQGNDVVYLDGGVDGDTLIVSVGENKDFLLNDGAGNTQYASGTGDTVITIINIEHGQVIASDETIMYEW